MRRVLGDIRIVGPVAEVTTSAVQQIGDRVFCVGRMGRAQEDAIAHVVVERGAMERDVDHADAWGETGMIETNAVPLARGGEHDS